MVNMPSELQGRSFEKQPDRPHTGMVGRIHTSLISYELHDRHYVLNNRGEMFAWSLPPETDLAGPVQQKVTGVDAQKQTRVGCAE
jgi:hypothetical protein